MCVRTLDQKSGILIPNFSTAELPTTTATATLQTHSHAKADSYDFIIFLISSIVNFVD